MHEDKRVEGAVSLWVGNSSSRDALETNNISHLSRLAKDFRTGWYDHDFMDTSFHEKPTRCLPDLLHRCSYASLIVPKFVKLCGEFLPTEVDSVVLLYNFQHNGRPGAGADAAGRVKLRYMGSITVEMRWPAE